MNFAHTKVTVSKKFHKIMLMDAFKRSLLLTADILRQLLSVFCFQMKHHSMWMIILIIITPCWSHDWFLDYVMSLFQLQRLYTVLN